MQALSLVQALRAPAVPHVALALRTFAAPADAVGQVSVEACVLSAEVLVALERRQ